MLCEYRHWSQITLTEASIRQEWLQEGESFGLRFVKQVKTPNRSKWHWARGHINLVEEEHAQGQGGMKKPDLLE